MLAAYMLTNVCCCCCLLYMQVLGRGSEDERARNLTAVLDGYFAKGGHHINV
jgi:pyruvate-formate lyase